MEATAVHIEETKHTEEEVTRLLVSVVVPAYNEAAIIQRSLSELCDYMETLEDEYDWEIIVVDESKLSPRLGTNCPVPVEVVPFGCKPLAEYLASLGARITVRHQRDGSPFCTDQGNMILDCAFGQINNPVELAGELKEKTGIVEHGLFIGLTSLVIVASEQGVRELEPG